MTLSTEASTLIAEQRDKIIGIFQSRTGTLGQPDHYGKIAQLSHTAQLEINAGGAKARAFLDRFRPQNTQPVTDMAHREAGPRSRPIGRRVGIAIIAVFVVALLVFFVVQSASRRNSDIRYNQAPQYDFRRSDGQVIHCRAERPSIVESARSTTVKAEVAGLIRVAQGTTNDSSSIQRIRGEAQGTDLFEAKKFAICEAYGNNALTPQQYNDLLVVIVRGAPRETTP
jgi:hypothetical protein